MLELPRKYIVMASKSWGRAISGPVLVTVGLILLACQLSIRDSRIAELVLKVCSWSSLSIAGLMVFIAQYEVWKEEHAARTKVEAELTSKADVRGITRIEISGRNPYKDQTKTGSRFRCDCDCSNHGKTECEIGEIWAWIEPPGRKTDSGVVKPHKFAIYDSIPPQVVGPGRAFRYQHEFVVEGISPEELRAAEVVVVLKDGLDNDYKTDTRISPRFLVEGL
jgi:hypothetical protein